MNEAAEIVHSVAHQDANIIFGSVVDEAMGDAVRVTVIAAGFERWEAGAAEAREDRRQRHARPRADRPVRRAPRSASEFSFDLDDDGDDDIPSFLR